MTDIRIIALLEEIAGYLKPAKPIKVYSESDIVAREVEYENQITDLKKDRDSWKECARVNTEARNSFSELIYACNKAHQSGWNPVSICRVIEAYEALTKASIEI